MPSVSAIHLRTNADTLMFWDQDALNATLHGRWKPCPPIWNAVGPFFEDRSAAELDISEQDLFDVRSNPRIVHFTGSEKPWNYHFSHPFKNEY